MELTREELLENRVKEMRYTKFNIEDLKDALLLKYQNYMYVCKNIGFCKSYTWEVLNGYKKGSIEFFNACIDCLEIQLTPEQKALKITELLRGGIA